MKDVQIQIYRESKLSRAALSARILKENRTIWTRSRTTLALYACHGLTVETAGGVTYVIFKKRGSYWHDAIYVAVRLSDYWRFVTSAQYRLWRSSF